MINELYRNCIENRRVYRIGSGASWSFWFRVREARMIFLGAERSGASWRWREARMIFLGAERSGASWRWREARMIFLGAERSGAWMA